MYYEIVTFQNSSSKKSWAMYRTAVMQPRCWRISKLGKSLVESHRSFYSNLGVGETTYHYVANSQLARSN